jgi:hypothetical protein
MTRTARTTKNFTQGTYKTATKVNKYVQKKQAAKAEGLRVVTRPAKAALNKQPLKTGETRKAEKVDKK